jgi:hypothetical protein
VKDELLEKVSGLAEEALEHNNPVEEMFADEVEKSVRLLDLFLYDYDVVLSNPPYLTSGKMGDELKQFVKKNYTGSRDLYTAFIERCAEFSDEKKYLSMITPETFMYQYSYRKMRPDLLKTMNFVDVAHLENRDEGYMNVCYSIRKSTEENHTPSRFNRLIKNENKERGLREVSKSNRSGRKHKDVYVVDQKAFLQIDRSPFVYWFGEEILQLFSEYQKVSEVAEVLEGLTTGDDEKFVRAWWAVDRNRIGEDYKWIAMSGEYSDYYYSQEKVVYWRGDGKKIKQYDGSYVRNSEFYEKPGITFRTASKYFTARLHPEGYIFSTKSRLIYTGNKTRDYELLGYLCSSLIKFIMQGLNPGLDFNVGDVKELPINENIEKGSELESLTQRGVALQKRRYSIRETKQEFEASSLLDNISSLWSYTEMCESDIFVIQGLIDEIVFSEYNISEERQKHIYKNLPKNLANYPHITNAGSLDTDEHEFREEVPTKELPEDDYEQLIEDIDDLKDNELREISEELEVSPYTVAMVRHEHDLYTRDEKRKTAGRLLSYYLGCAMGRWELEGLEPDDDGIIVFDDGFDDNVMRFMRDCIELTYGEDELYSKEQEIEEMLNKDIEDWLRDTFFRYHHCKEYRRRGQRIPIYWQLASDEGHFNCFVYYHRMDEDTLPKVRGQYLDEKIDRLRNRRDTLQTRISNADEDEKPELRSEEEEIEEKIDDLTDFRDRLDNLIDEGFAPDFEAGIWENIQEVDEHDLLAVPLDKL